MARLRTTRRDEITMGMATMIREDWRDGGSQGRENCSEA